MNSLNLTFCWETDFIAKLTTFIGRQVYAVAMTLFQVSLSQLNAHIEVLSMHEEGILQIHWLLAFVNLNLYAKVSVKLRDNLFAMLTSNFLRKVGTILYVSKRLMFLPMHVLDPAPK